MSTLRVAMACLAADLRIGDVITDAGLGGSWDGEIDSVRSGPDLVFVDIWTQRLCFRPGEMMGVLRVAGREVQGSGAAGLEVNP